MLARQSIRRACAGASFALSNRVGASGNCSTRVRASTVTTRTIGLLGASFALLGVLALLLPGGAQILMLGAGFGGLHIVFGILIGRIGHGRQI